VRFYDRKVGTVVKLTVAYAIPGIVGQVMDDLFLGRVVESTYKQTWKDSSSTLRISIMLKMLQIYNPNT
jgi:uncharacterized membrane protein